MRKFVVADPNAQVTGRLMLSLIKNINVDEIMPVLTKHGLESIEPEKWYPFQNFLDALKDVAQGNVNATENLVAIGVKASETAVIPAGIDSLASFMELLNDVSSANSRNIVPEERYDIKVIAPGRVHVTNNRPYPDDAIFGFLWGAAKRFSPEGFLVRPIKRAAPDSDESTTFEITWGPSLIVSDYESDETQFIASSRRDSLGDQKEKNIVSNEPDPHVTNNPDQAEKVGVSAQPHVELSKDAVQNVPGGIIDPNFHPKPANALIPKN